ncbi:hypothetical protein ACFSCX_01825 [Bacillus salitolerans]|uniref:FbpB family small basic protein n=1 Tax=Bacillus salitolerans TaxID=1437434 RepID=A0ABW4LKL8_9BACI
MKVDEKKRELELLLEQDETNLTSKGQNRRKELIEELMHIDREDQSISS